MHERFGLYTRDPRSTRLLHPDLHHHHYNLSAGSALTFPLPSGSAQACQTIRAAVAYPRLHVTA